MSTRGTVKSGNLEADIVIIGGGGAGLAAALTASENGVKNIIVLEKLKETGGNSARARGLFGAETHLQRHEMIDISKDDYFKRAVEWHHYKVNPRILRAWINKSSDTIRWLTDKGVEFDLGPRHRMHFNQLPAWHVAKGNFGPVMRLLAQNCRDAGIQILVDTNGKKILRDSKGNITAVLATQGREELRIQTRSVVVTTGGFTGNKRLLKKYFPFYDEFTFPTGCLPNQGDGIRLVVEVGGAIEDYATLVREICYSRWRRPPPRVRTTEPTEAPPPRRGAGLNDPTREPYIVWVNKLGERFVEEAAGFALQTSTNALLRQPDKIAYALYDDDIVQSVMENGFVMSKNDDTRGLPIPDFREDLQAETEAEEWVKMSNNWDDIARWIGAEPEVLKATVDEYNSFCDHGYDATFLKDRRYLVPLRKPPYYAIKFRASVYDAIGPIKINHNMEVVDKQYKPVPGLFAGGSAAGGWQSDDYCGDVLFGGALSFAINSGRIAGESVAKYVLGK